MVNLINHPLPRGKKKKTGEAQGGREWFLKLIKNASARRQAPLPLSPGAVSQSQDGQLPRSDRRPSAAPRAGAVYTSSGFPLHLAPTVQVSFLSPSQPGPSGGRGSPGLNKDKERRPEKRSPQPLAPRLVRACAQSSPTPGARAEGRRGQPPPPAGPQGPRAGWAAGKLQEGLGPARRGTTPALQGGNRGAGDRQPSRPRGGQPPPTAAPSGSRRRRQRRPGGEPRRGGLPTLTGERAEAGVGEREGARCCAQLGQPLLLRLSPSVLESSPDAPQPRSFVAEPGRVTRRKSRPAWRSHRPAVTRATARGRSGREGLRPRAWWGWAPARVPGACRTFWSPFFPLVGPRGRKCRAAAGIARGPLRISPEIGGAARGDGSARPGRAGISRGPSPARFLSPEVLGSRRAGNAEQAGPGPQSSRAGLGSRSSRAWSTASEGLFVQVSAPGHAASASA